MKSFARSAAVSAALVGGLMSLDASAVNISTDQIGEVAIVPYYNARDDFQTFFSMINTRDVPMVVKVRVHEGRNSRDVLDFDVALSSFDVFSGVLRKATVKGVVTPVIEVKDQADAEGRRTCTIPSIVGTPDQKTPLSPLAFGPPGTPDDDGGPIGATPGVLDIGLNADAALRMSEGYIEFIVMGYAEGDDEGVGGGSLADVGSAIESHNCALLDTAFVVHDQIGPVDNRIVLTAQQFGEPINALKVNASLFNVTQGFETNIPVLTLANFYNPAGVTPQGSTVNTPTGEMGQVPPTIGPAQNVNCTVDRGFERRDNNVNWFPNGNNGSCMNLITAQVVPDFLEPTLNDAYPQVANYWDDSRNFPAYAVPLGLILCPAGFGANPDCGASEHVRGVDAVSLLIQRAAVFNEWTNNVALSTTSSDWIVTLPTKGFYVDGGYGNGDNGPGMQSAVVPGGIGNLYVPFGGGSKQDGGRDETILSAFGLPVAASMPYHPFSHNFGQQYPDGTDHDGRYFANSCNRVGVTVYDRAEQFAGTPPDGGVIVSPAPPPVIATLNLCYETNVISFDGITALDSQYPLLNTDGSDTWVDTSGLQGLYDGALEDNDAGWLSLRLDRDDGAFINAWQADGPYGGHARRYKRSASDRLPVAPAYVRCYLEQ